MKLRRLVDVITKRRQKEAVAESILDNYVTRQRAHLQMEAFHVAYPHLKLDIQDISRLN